MFDSFDLGEGYKGFSVARIKQLKKILKEEGISIPKDLDLDEEDRKSLINNMKNESRGIINNLIERQANGIEYDKDKKKLLESFIASYVVNLTKDQYLDLTRVIQRYISFFDFNGDSDFASELLEDSDKSILSVMTSLCVNSLLLPNIRNQKDFNREMWHIFHRIEKYIERETKEKGVLFTPFKYGDLLEVIRKSEKEIFSGGMRLSGIPNYFKYDFDLQKESNDTTKEVRENKIRYTFTFSKIGDVGLERDDVLNLLDENFEKIKDGIYFVDSNNNVSLFVEARLPHIDKSVDNEYKKYFDLEFFIEEKRELETEEFMYYSLNLLEEHCENFVNHLYKIFRNEPKVQNLIHISIEQFVKDSLIDSEEEDLASTTSKHYSHSKNGKTNGDNTLKLDKKLEIDNIILGDKEKEELLKLIDIYADPDYYIKNGLELPKGTILYGPPGTGKTLFVKTIASLIDAEFLIIEHTDIESKWVGQSEKNIKKEFEKARELVKKGKKVIIFIDEGDSLFEKRGDEKNHKEGIVSVMLGEMDGFDESLMKNIFVVVATNRIEAIDPALKRRFDKKVKIDLPNKENLEKIINLHLSKYNKDLFEDNLDISKLASKLVGESGGIVAKLLNNAVSGYLYNKKFREETPIISIDYILSLLHVTKEQIDNDGKIMGFNTN